jgi:hypothetical protein
VIGAAPAAALVGSDRVSVLVEGSAGVVGALRDYFAPWWSLPLGGDWQARITLLHGSPPPGVLAGWDASAVERQPRLHSENASTTLMVESCAGARHTVFRFPETATWLTADAARACFAMWATSDETLFWDAKELVQSHIVRPLLLRQKSLLHAAALEAGGAGWLICGPKGAGKTTVQLHLLGVADGLVATDRTYLGVDDGTVVAYGHPGRARLREDAFRRHPELGRPDQGLAHDGPAKLVMDTKVLAARMGTRVVPAMAATHVVILVPGGGVRRLQAQEAAAGVAPHWLDVDPLVPDWLLPRSGDAAAVRRQQEIVRRCRVLAAGSEWLLAQPPAMALRSLAAAW